MRKDMNKVVTERPRHGGYDNKIKKWDKVNTPYDKQASRVDDDREFLPKKESIRKRHKLYDSGKELSDFLNPLYRFLHSRVGNKWDDVWSEVCSVLKGNGVLERHVKDHIKSYVKGIPFSNYRFDAGDKIFEPGYVYYGMKSDGTPGTLYVDKNKVLRMVPYKKKKYKAEPYNYKYLVRIETHDTEADNKTSQTKRFDKDSEARAFVRKYNKTHKTQGIKKYTFASYIGIERVERERT